MPTWNYEAVHAHGRLRIIDEEKFVRGLVGRLTREHERSEAAPWRMSDAPRDFIDQLLAQIVGIEIELTRLEGKRKLSQNKDARDREGVIHALREKHEHGMVAAMERPASSSD
ncbi:FMN-binding negative transcriptional regulator [Candidatus Dactylopiibacterium carminicum]|uniref:FMN-binding negative transcriptional regulator n=1 Tax=Candidatus Dactylopiibacterium carminicum TaxID=857335 RepID=UPI0021E0EE76|nr:FMN-binding negative transcriptional regulator [Candidatus Dactylopiibacterium carminicum]